MASNKYDVCVKPKLQLIERWAEAGLTDKQIAKNLGISLSTYYDYQKKYPEFSESLKKGKEIADYEVENALYKRATGCTLTETVKERRNGSIITTKEIIKDIAPDVTAIIYWLKNRCPDKWRDRPHYNDVDKLDAVLDMIEGNI